MRKSKALVMSVLVLSLVLVPLTPACSPSSPTGLKVVTSTSLLASIVERVGGDRVDVVNIIPPAQCPGYFDVKPGDVQKLACVITLCMFPDCAQMPVFPGIYWKPGCKVPFAGWSLQSPIMKRSI